ncbi:MAG: tetratricopeptide repeat protein [Casimicrobiaceae bacterium]
MTADSGKVLGLLARAFDLQQRGQFADADALYVEVLGMAPDDPTALVNGGVLALARGDVGRAVARLEHGARVAPRNAIARDNLALALLHAGRADEALTASEAAIALQPRLATAHNHRGIALTRLRRNAEARAAFGQAMALDPRLLAAALNFGDRANDAGDAREAALAYDRALTLEPGNLHAATGRAFATALAGDLTGATRALEDTVARAPQHAPAWQTLGAVRNFAWDHDGAEAAFQRASALTSGGASAQFGVASARLGRGDFAAGWQAFEQRPDRAAEVSDSLAALPPWDGGDFDGTLVVYGEQGFGDVLQFARFIPLARRQVRNVVLLLGGDHARLAPLLATLDADVPVISRMEDLPTGGRLARISILSLPHRLAIDANGLGMAEPYLHAPGDRLGAWTPRLATLPRPRVGLAWSVLARDVHGFVTRHKSIPPPTLATLLHQGGGSFVTLQPGREGDPAAFGRDGARILDVRPYLLDFADTAALVAQLDLVISADTAVAHLAGALGVPVWMLDRANSCWRWRGGSDASPWYPSMRIFRQARFGEWSDVGARVATAFAELRPKL